MALTKLTKPRARWATFKLKAAKAVSRSIYDKMLDSGASVKDFGAIAGSDATASIQAAVSSGHKLIYITEDTLMEGIVTVPSSCSLVIQKGAKLVIKKDGYFKSNVGSFDMTGHIVHEGRVALYGELKANTVSNVNIDVTLVRTGAEDKALNAIEFTYCRAKRSNIKVRAADSGTNKSEGAVVIVRAIEDNVCEQWTVDVWCSGYGAAYVGTQVSYTESGYSRDFTFNIVGINCTKQGFSCYHTRRAKIKSLYLYGNDEPAYIWLGTEGHLEHAEFVNAEVGAHIEQLGTTANVTTSSCNVGVVLTWGITGILNIVDRGSINPVKINSDGNTLATSTNTLHVHIDHVGTSTRNDACGVRVIQTEPSEHPITEVHVSGTIKGEGKGIFASGLLPGTKIISTAMIDTTNSALDVRTADIADPCEVRQIGGRLSGAIRTDCSGTSKLSITMASIEDYVGGGVSYWEGLRGTNIVANCFDEKTGTIKP